jgi:hypothetical protein
MPGFFTNSELASLRKTAEVSLVDDVDIWPRAVNTDENDPNNIYEDSGAVSYAYRETVKGWIFSSPNQNAEAVGGIIGTLNLYRVFMPVGTEVTPGDRLFIKGDFFELIDTVDESTWLPILRCSARRLE